MEVKKESVTITTVRRDVFQEWIPQTGTVEPIKTVYLDAVEGGAIKQIYLQSGSIVKKNDVILQLTNLNRELNVLQQEASLNETISRLRNTRLRITKNDLRQRQTLSRINNQLSILQPKYDRQKRLFEKKLISKQEFEKTEADYQYNLQNKAITYEVYRTDSIDRLRQITEINLAEEKMIRSLQGMGTVMDNLVIRAPIDGQLSRPQLVVGQNVTPGQTLGQIDVLSSYRVTVQIDELYLPRITTGLRATTNFANNYYELEIIYVYPGVTDGRFRVDMKFIGQTPPGIGRGQSLRLRIALGQSSEELILPAGDFYKGTGGNWVFVVNKNENQAKKRTIKLGRKSGDEYFEVLEGLEVGDKVITSSYDDFANSEILVFQP